ncbi:MAG TPA: cbb3-type cytochrome c oxidase N-terminal domain-containing protein [Parafilimonas sp.]|nr:cbb3-type cytochrome c oxidase N-terminal domain-containing protein [Parafilimonas sp.]
MKKNYRKLIAFVINIVPLSLFAQGPPKVNEAKNPQAIALFVIAAILALAIYIAGKMLVQQAKINMKKIKKETAGKVVSVLLPLFVSTALFAQDASPAAADAAAQTAAVVKSAGPLSSTSFYVLIAVIAAEIIILISILIQVRALMRANEEVPVVESAAATELIKEKSFSWKKVWNKLNSFKSIKEEADIDMGHDYDGIRELDNRLPPWWIWGFYICIVFAGIYLWRFHVSHTGPSSVQEYRIAMQEAEAQRAVYLSKSKNNVDENTVTQLTEASDLDAGKKAFIAMCAACHAADGGGTVGPNLTDDYWLHGGSVKDVFKTITYGWPDKGMKSWKDDYSPLQIQQITSYVLSLHGTKPATPKEPQGTLYKASDAPAADSSANKATDSTANKTTVTASVK